MKFCEECGAQHKDDAIVCEKCGTPFETGIEKNANNIVPTPKPEKKLSIGIIVGLMGGCIGVVGITLVILLMKETLHYIKPFRISHLFQILILLFMIILPKI